MSGMGAASVVHGDKRAYRVPVVPIESNSLIFPFFLLSRESKVRQRWFSYERTIVHVDEHGAEHRLRQVWEVQGGGRTGLPRRSDMDVYFGLGQLAEENGGMPEDGLVPFSMYELLELIRWTRGKYERLRESIQRTAAASVTSRKAFWSPRRQSFVDDTIHLFSSSLRKHAEHRDRYVERHHVRYSELVVECHRYGYLDRVDPGFYWSLEDVVSRRLYLLLDHHCASGAGAAWQTDPFSLAGLMPLGPYGHGSQIERVLRAAHEELQEKGYLKTLEVERGRRNAPLSFAYELAPSFARRRLDATVRSDPAGAIALEKLLDLKVRYDKAVSLVAEYGAPHCSRYTDELPFLRGVDPRRQAGLVINGIETSADWSTWPKISVTGGDVRPRRPEAPDPEAAPKPPLPSSDPEPDLRAEKVWEQVLEGVQEEIDAPSWRVWFEGTVPVALDGALLTVSVPNSFAKEYIEGRFEDLLEEQLRGLLGEDASLKIVIGRSDGGDR